MLNFFNTIGAIFVEVVARFVNRVQWFLVNINISSYRWPLVIIDIFLVTVLVYWLYLFFRETKARYILHGLLVIGVIYLFAEILQLNTVLWVINKFFTFFIIAFLIIFQPELRRALEKLGRSKFLGEFKNKKTPLEENIDKIIKAIKILSSQKTGALIVIKGQDDLSEYVSRGIILDAYLSTELLLNIFYPGSPLHDGAVIIDKNRIIAAACILPITEEETSNYTLGTRHKAALGLSSETDALIIVVSEERGVISTAYKNKLRENLSLENLKKICLEFFKK